MNAQEQSQEIIIPTGMAKLAAKKQFGLKPEDLVTVTCPDCGLQSEMEFRHYKATYKNQLVVWARKEANKAEVKAYHKREGRWDVKSAVNEAIALFAENPTTEANLDELLEATLADAIADNYANYKARLDAIKQRRAEQAIADEEWRQRNRDLWEAEMEQRKELRQRNAALKARGYRWEQFVVSCDSVPDQHLDRPEWRYGADNYGNRVVWQVVAPDGRVLDEQAALEEIGY